MKNKAKKIIRNILIGAVASIYNTDVQAADNSVKPLLEGLTGDDKESAVSALKNKIIKNVLQIKKNGDTKLIAGHRSHMSHRSGGGGGGGGHYSHASHYSSYGGGSSGHSSHSSHSSSSYGTTYSEPKPAPKTYKNYDLGDRTLQSGLYGNDVSQLTSLLVSKKYMNSSWITMQNGYPVYNARVVSAVIRFQKDAGKAQDGVMTSSLATALENWDESKTTLVLGIRNLGYNEAAELAGDDVYELIALLRNAGFPPDPSKLKYNGSKAVFTKDIETAVKLFQAYNGLTPDGKVDETTISKLKAVAKKPKWN